MNNDSGVLDDKSALRDTLDLSTVVWRRLSGGRGCAATTLEYAFVTHGADPSRSAATDTYVVLRQCAGNEDTLLVFTPSEWDAFLRGARDGEFDRPW